MTEPITIETYCQVCSHPLGPDDDPRGFHRGPCPGSVSIPRVACIACGRPCSEGDPPGSMCRDCWYVRRVPRGTRVQPVTNQQETPHETASVTGLCRECHKVLVKPKRGPMPAFCSHACRQAAHRRES